MSSEENKVLHALQTVGQLSSKTANRVYHSVAAQLKTIKKEDVATYIDSVVSILHLTHFLNIGQKEIADNKNVTSPTSTSGASSPLSPDSEKKDPEKI